MKGEDDEIRIAQLLVSRLSHDLVGTVGAVNAGLELLQEAGSIEIDADADALALAAKSARQMGRKVTFFRIAFGAGLAGNGNSLAEARALAEGFLADGAVRLDWADFSAETGKLPPEAGKVLLNLVLLGAESLPRGGAVSVSISMEPAEKQQFFLNVMATGDRAGLRAEALAGLALDARLVDMNARSIHGFFTNRLVRSLCGDAGGGLHVQRSEGQVTFKVGPIHLID